MLLRASLAPILGLTLMGCSSGDARGICPDPSQGTGSWSGWVGGLGSVPPTTDGTQVFLWFCDSSECWLTAFDSQRQLTGTMDLPPGVRRERGKATASSEHVLVLGGYPDRTDYTAVPSSALLYNRDDDSWGELPHPDWFRTGMDHEVVWTGSAFLTWGGWRDPGMDGAKPHGELEVGALIDPVTGTWSSITGSGRPDGQGPMIWTSEGLFLWVYSPDQTTPSAWLYSPEDDSWEALPLDPSLTPRYPSLAVSDDAVYVVGGDPYRYNSYYRYERTDTWFRQVWEFRLSDRTWRRLAVPGDAAVGTLARVVDDRLYLLDGACAPGSFFTPSTGEWGATAWPDELEWPQYLLEVDGKLSIYGDSRHIDSYGSFFQYTP